MKISFVLMFMLVMNYNTFTQSSRKYHAFSGSVVLSVEGGTALAATDYLGTQPDYLGRFSMEFFLPSYTISSFALKIIGINGFFSEEDFSRKIPVFRTSFSTLGAGFVYSLNASKTVSPYLFAGLGYLWFDPRDEDGNIIRGREDFSKQEINYLGEFGLRFLVTDNLSVNLNTGIQVSPNDFWDASQEGTSNDLMITITGGLSFSLFSEIDSDKDGIGDSRDLCPGTPPGVDVDNTGCPKDSDKDGVPDYKDRCSGTGRGVSVDQYGCPSDSDADGVPDFRDVCPDTPSGMQVDESGCIVDHDSDGIQDNDDKCPDTPKGVEVNEAGCPKDDDLDGVPDYLDKCPKTPAGQKVDKEGCALQGDVIRMEKGSKEVILSSGATFASGSSEILPAAYEDLNKLLYEMKEEPLSRWRIEGYTDNVGSEASNKRISVSRAEAVVQFFVSRGISKSRFEAEGFGEDNPVATNQTPEGRSMNRRVRIIRIN